jgi:hypothetical protein
MVVEKGDLKTALFIQFISDNNKFKPHINAAAVKRRDAIKTLGAKVCLPANKTTVSSRKIIFKPTKQKEKTG